MGITSTQELTASFNVCPCLLKIQTVMTGQDFLTGGHPQGQCVTFLLNALRLQDIGYRVISANGLGVPLTGIMLQKNRVQQQGGLLHAASYNEDSMEYQKDCRSIAL